MQLSEIHKGHLLIATPEIDSGIFFRTVILICEHSDKGSLGVIINKSIDLIMPSELLEIQAVLNPNLTFCASGPMQTNQLLLLHSEADKVEESLTSNGAQNTLEICEGVYLGGDLSFLQKSAIDTDGPYLKLCFGYAGWGPQQLEKEFSSGSWLLHPAKASHVFQVSPEELWRQLLREMGGRYAMLSMIPDNLSLN
jgi:putative transcriptional regulator